MKVRPTTPGGALPPSDADGAEAPEKTPEKARAAAPLIDRLEEADGKAMVVLADNEATPNDVWVSNAPPAPEPSGDGPVVVDWNGLSGKVGPVSVSADRLGLYFDGGVEKSTETQTSASTVSVGHRNLQLTADHSFSDAPGRPSVNGYVGYWDGSVAVGGGASITSADESLTGLLDTWVTFDRTASHLGRYEGDDPKLEGTHQVQVHRNLGGTTILGLQKLAGAIGIGGMLTPSGSKDLVYRTYLPKEDAARVLLERKGVVGFLRDRARAVGLAKENVLIPKLDEPDTMKVGDELELSTTGALSVGLSAGAFGLSAGAQVVLHGQFDVAVKKTGEQEVELTVTPAHLRALQAFVGLPLLGDAGVDASKARSLTQSFVFDLSRPEAKQAYLAALEGVMPGGVGELERASGAELRSKVKNEQLPEGVTRRFVEAQTGKRTTVGGGINFALVQEGSPIGGLGYYRTRATGRREITDGKVLVVDDTRDIERRAQVLISGTEKLGVRAAKRTVTEFDDGGNARTAFGGVKLTATFADDRVRKLELNDEVIERINKAFGLSIAPMKRGRKNQEWEVQLSRELSAAELDRLANAALPDVERVEREVGLDEMSLATLTRALAGAKDPSERADRLLAFVSEHGLRAFAALHRLLGPEGLAVVRSTNAYDSALEKVTLLELKYPEPFRIEEGSKALVQRFADTEKVLEDLDRARLDLTDDPFAGAEEQASTKKLLDEGRERAKRIIAVDHLTGVDRAALHETLGRGWVTSREERVREHLEKAGLS